MKIPWCAVCQRPVDVFIEHAQDVRSMRQTFEARCHGERQFVTLDDELWIAARSVEIGTAFQREALGGE